MTLKGLHILSIVVLTMVFPGGELSAQETLKASRVEARRARRHLPALGLPIKADGGIDRKEPYIAGKTVEDTPQKCLLACQTCHLTVGGVAEIGQH